MPQDAFTLRYIAKELKQRLTGGKISKIVQPDRDNLIFIIYTANGNVKLEACLSAQASRLSLTDGETTAPLTAPNFCMLLRKHLQNAEILDIEQPDFERIIYFDLKCVSDFSESVMRLYFEIMGKYSNAVLTENGVITGALKTTSIGENTKRVLFGGVKYTLPEPQDKFPPEDTAAVAEALKRYEGDKAGFISGKVKGISYATADEISNSHNGNPSAEDIKNYVFGTVPAPCVTFVNGEPNDFKVVSVSKDKKEFDSVLGAQSYYYSYITRKKKFGEKKNRLLSALDSGIKKIDKKLANMRDKLEECKDTEIIRLKGELITANIYSLSKGMTGFEAVNYYDEDCKKITVALDKTLTPSQNAQRYFKKYAKLKRTKQNVDVQLATAIEQKDYLNGIRTHVCTAEEIMDLEETERELAENGLVKKTDNRKKNPVLTPYREYGFEGFKILAGRNNLQNERLTKSLSPNDLWLHTQKYHSSHVAVITEGRPARL